MVTHCNYSLNLHRMWENKETLLKVTSSRADTRSSTGEAVKLFPRHHTMASECYKLQINNSSITSIPQKSTMEWQGLEHALECLILNLDKPSKPLLGLWRDHVLDDCPQKLHVKRFHLLWLARPIDSKRQTLIKLIGLLLGKAVKERN